MLESLIRKTFPFLFIFLVWSSFAFPYFIKNKTPFPSAYLVNFFSPWNAYENFWQPVKNDAMPDVIGQIYPWKMLTIESLKKGEFPLWNPYSFSGNPHLADYQTAVLSPFNILFFILRMQYAWILLVLFQPLLAGIFTFLFARSLKISILGSLLSGVSFMFCGFITVWLAYATLAYAILFLPLALYAVQKFYDTNRNFLLFLLSFSIPLSFFSGHFQTSFYFLIFLTSFAFLKFYQTRDKLPLLKILVFIFFGILISSPQLIPSIELYFNAPRSQIFSKIEAIPLFYFPTIFAPDFFGNPVTRNYTIGHYAEWASYPGILTLFFAIFALLKNRNKEILFFSAAGILSLLLAYNTPFLDLLIKTKIPVLSTSAASRIIVIFSFSVAILGGFGFDKLHERLKENAKEILIYIFSFALILVGLILYAKFSHLVSFQIALRNLILPFFIFTVTAVSILFSKLNKKAVLFSSIVIIILNSFDMLRFTTKWQPFDPINLVFPNAPVTSFFPKISGNERSFGNFGAAEVSVFYKLPSVEGYDPLYIERYGQFLSSIHNGKIGMISRSGVDLDNRGENSHKVFDFLGIKYIIFKNGDKGKVWGFPFLSYPKDQFKIVYVDKKFTIYENKSVLPRAFFVKDYRVEANDQKIIDTMFNKNLNLRNTAVLENDPQILPSKGRGIAKITSYQNNKVEIQTSNSSPSILVLTDNFYPGWVAKIDGVKTPIIRADFTFRAVSVPQGNHTVIFSYEPASFKIGVLLAILGIIGISGFFITGTFKKAVK